MKEIVVISGKGGTGKTSLAASFAALAGDVVLADCDVDAADLHLVLSAQVKRHEAFWSGREAVIRTGDCSGCGVCVGECRFHAIQATRSGGGECVYSIDPLYCEGCGVCVHLCPEQAIDFPEKLCGEWLVSETRFGPMVHARLAIAVGNSGKLVSLVRTEARKIAEERGTRWIIVDGPPGLGCPVIASITGAALVLVVTEPTLSGVHDMERVLVLTKHFGIPTLVCINKWELNPQITEQIGRSAKLLGASIVGRICYDRAVTSAQVDGITVVEFGGRAAAEIRQVWQELEERVRSTELATTIQV